MNLKKHTIILLAALLALLALAACQMVAPANTTPPSAAPPPTEELATLRANPWQWVAFTSPVEQFDVEAPLSYLVQFNADATVNIVADCNNAVGAYQGEGGKLQIELGRMTAAACPPDSRSDQFVRLLSGAALYFFQEGNLHIDLFADGGTMVFSPAPPDIFGDDGEGAVGGLPETVTATLGNLSYPGLFDDREIALTNGAFTETGDAGTIAVQLLDPFIATGDLNGDGSTDAVALLELDTSGTGRFTYLAPVLDVLTAPAVGPTVMVEDRIQPTSLTIADNQVVFEYVGHGEGDGECCPSWNIRHAFAWQDGALVEVSREAVSKVEAAGPAGSLVQTDAWAPVACDTLGVSAEIAALADCGYVTVPENRTAGTDKTIQLAVMRIRSIGEAPASDPLVMEQGGPGGSTIGFFPHQIRKLAEILNQRDIVLVEQRGTQYSIPWLDCSAERNAHNIAVAKGEAEDDGSYLNACKAKWDEQGIDLSAFNDTENAADIYAAVAALGYDHFNYYGVSYGTELGQHVMKAAADHQGVLRSVILDSVVPIDIEDQPLKDMIASQALRTMFENCAQDATCSQDFPDLEQKTLALLEQMNVTPVVVTATLPSGEQLPLPVTGSDLFQLMWSNLYSWQTIRQLPGILDTMIQQGDFSWVAKQKSDGLALTPGGMAEGMHLSMWCPRLGNAPFLGTDLFAPAYPQANIVELALPDYARRCQIMDVGSAGAADFVYPDADIPTLILSGAMDPATPPQYAAHVAENLKTAYAYTLPDAAHNVMLDSPTPCALNMAAAFLADPSQTPDSTCVEELKPVFARRVTPLDEMTFETRTVITGVTASIPTAFADPQGTGLYSDPADPINIPTGLVRFAVVTADTVDAALASLKDSTVIAEDEAIGTYRWKIVESRTMMKGVIARGAATALPDGEHYLTIIVAGPENRADAIFATLLEPILSSIKAE